MDHGVASTNEIQKYTDITFDTFLKDHLLPNRPLVLSAKNTEHWPSTKGWRIPESVTRHGDGHLPALDALRVYGHHVVPVADTSTRSFSEFERSERHLVEVLDIWAEGKGQGLYVKDWHLFDRVEKEARDVREVYEVPEIFRDDWMNPPFDGHGSSGSIDDAPDDFRFCYLGPAGTFTPLHRDVYASYSWSANVVGRKQWWFFPPDRLGQVKVDGELVFDVRELEGEGGGIKVVQEEGEIIFVPSGWHHQVLNLDFCISINHNFASSSTIPRLFDALCDAQARVEESIVDVKEMIQRRLGKDGPWEAEWVEEVQGLLERDAGWGWQGFWNMILCNLQCSPAPVELSAPIPMRDALVRTAIRRYRQLPCATYLPLVDSILASIEVVLDSET